ncbi:hypothetical protein [Pseudomonas phage PlaquesPlease]|uniref:Uncharacterized protein n=1 Tax=Pseudomonas phage PlaquesPlease TaxID=2762289 RepID=A0A7G8LJU1_9CAUD|nr:hypothetical protein [Pseudomonas phage PlaquesPlease]
MAKTLKLNVSFPMTIVVATETIEALKLSREEARKVPAEKIAELKGEAKYRAELFRGDKSEEELMELIYRAGIREFITKDMRREISGDEAKVRLGSVKVAYESRPDVCTCGPNEGCGRCPGKRWTQTV